MMIRTHYIMAAMALAISAGAQAQTGAAKDTTMNKVMVIENEYIPQISEASKINVMPEVKTPEVTKKKVEYATTSSPSKSVPTNVMDPMMGKEEQAKASNGYVRVGFGNYRNMDLLGNYLFNLSSRDKLNIDAQLEGMNGKLKYGNGEKHRTKYHKGHVGADYLHQFAKLDLNIAGKMGMSKFNYTPYISMPMQRFSWADAFVGVKSTDDDAEFSYKASTEYMYYQRRHSLYTRQKQVESRVRTNAEVTGDIDDEQVVAIAAEMNNMIYSGAVFDEFTDYTTVDLNPYYRYTDDSWMIKAGANVDLAFGYGKKLHVSPDITAEYTFADTYVAYLKATGGRRLNDFRRLEEENPYSFTTGNIANTYEQLNASIGLKASPVSGVWFGIYGGYQKMKDEAYSFCNMTTSASVYLVPGRFYSSNTSNAYAGLGASYSYHDMANVAASVVYRNWDADNELALLYKPKVELNFTATLKPVDKLIVELSYLYEKRAKDGAADLKVNAVNDLRLHLSYNFYKGVCIYANVNNILNKSYQHYFCYPTEKLNYLGGLSFRF